MPVMASAPLVDDLTEGPTSAMGEVSGFRGSPRRPPHHRLGLDGDITKALDGRASHVGNGLGLGNALSGSDGAVVLRLLEAAHSLALDLG
jgi:hypothetical protein